VSVHREAVFEEVTHQNFAGYRHSGDYPKCVLADTKRNGEGVAFVIGKNDVFPSLLSSTVAKVRFWPRYTNLVLCTNACVSFGSPATTPLPSSSLILPHVLTTRYSRLGNRLGISARLSRLRQR
jgi:hypothetical protein